MAVPPSAPTMDQRKQHAFTQLKVVCVPILSAARQPPSPATTASLVALLPALSRALLGVPSDVFSPALANYVFFPLSSLLQPTPEGADRGEVVLEATMSALATLVLLWRRAGIEMRILHELWIMSILRLGGPLDPEGPNGGGKGKGKAKDLTEEAQRAVLGVLLALMSPLELEPDKGGEESDDDPLGENIDWDADEPTMKPRPAASPPPALLPPPPIPILFHTLTTLLSIAAIPTSLPQLQLDALAALRILIQSYLAPHPASGPSPLLATALPGTASTLSRIALSVPRGKDTVDQARRQPSSAIVAALDVLSILVVAVTNDEVTRDLRVAVDEAPSATLEEVVEAYLSKPADEDEPPPTPVDVPTPPTPPPTGPTLPTRAWLTHTLGNLSTLFHSLSSLTAHESPVVRTALVSFYSELLATSSLSLSPTSHPIEPLLVLSSDAWPTVSKPALASLLASFALPQHRATASSLILARLAALPRSLLRRDEKTASTSARVVRVALDLLGETDTDVDFGSRMDKASWSLVRALAFERVVGAAEGGGGMSMAWITGGAVEEGAGDEWPELRMKWVKEESTRVALEELWVALGQWAGRRAREREVIDLFWTAAKGESQEGALWVLDGVLRGLEHGASKRTSKVVRSVVRDVLALLDQLELEHDEFEDGPRKDEATGTGTDDSLLVHDGPDDADALVSIEHHRGVSLTPSLDVLTPIAPPSSSRRDALASHRILLTSLLLRILSSSAAVLSSSFQPFLLQSLYHLLAHSSPPSHPLLRLHASTALSRIAFSTSYASPQNLVLANVDYVLNAVSQRLSIARLDPNAPIVLVEMIRLVGAPIVPMVQDLVEDVFEALDDYHGYEDVTVGLWAVLDALVRAMAGELAPLDATAAAASATRDPPDVGPLLNPERDLAAFEEWYVEYQATKEASSSSSAEDFGPSPQTPFESTVPPPEEPTPFPDSSPVPATRPQTTAAQILSKSTYYLSHASPFLRSRVLSLIASAVPLLATPSVSSPSENRQADLLPIIHRSWPYILNRLGDPEPYVLLEATALVESLATHVGEFMSRRILDDVWPRFRTILERQEKDDKGSAIAGKTAYSTSHRVHRAILNTMTCVARDVPLKEDVLWEMAVLFRPFLDDSREDELQEAARNVYRALARVNEDAVWLALSGTADDRLPLFLRTGGQVERNVRTLLLEMHC
ncbi:hypothetical protein RQP46_010452 [Phenoliferia psychrophenolica]